MASLLTSLLFALFSALLSAFLSSSPVRAAEKINAVIFNDRKLTGADHAHVQINGLPCSNHATTRALFCMQVTQVQKKQDFDELRKLVSEFPQVIRTLGLTDAKDRAGWAVFESNLAAVTLESDIKEPELLIEHGTGEPISKNEFALYLRLPVPFKLETLKKWGLKKSVDWKALLKHGYLQSDYNKEQLARLLKAPTFKKFYQPSALSIADVETHLLIQTQVLDGFLDSLARPPAVGCDKLETEFERLKEMGCISYPVVRALRDRFQKLLADRDQFKQKQQELSSTEPLDLPKSPDAKRYEAWVKEIINKSETSELPKKSEKEMNELIRAWRDWESENEAHLQRERARLSKEREANYTELQEVKVTSLEAETTFWSACRAADKKTELEREAIRATLVRCLRESGQTQKADNLDVATEDPKMESLESDQPEGGEKTD